MSNPVHGVNLRSSSLICEAHKNAVSAKAVRECPDCYRLLAQARDRHPLMHLDAATPARVAELEAAIQSAMDELGPGHDEVSDSPANRCYAILLDALNGEK